MTQNENLSLTELPSSPGIDFKPSGLSWRSRKFTENYSKFPFRDAWQRHQIKADMALAAFAILKGQPVPHDPVYSKPYQWNPQTRQLSRPEGPEFQRTAIKPITLPKLTP